MSDSSLEIPTNVSKPRCFVLEPITNQSQAHNQAGEHRSRVFGLDIKRLLPGRRDVTVETQLLERRMVAFWHVRCRSHFDYTRMKDYAITAQDPDAVSITIRGNDAQGSRLELLYRVDTTGRSKGQVNLSGIERCVTDRTVEEYIDSYTHADNLPHRELESRRKLLSDSAKQRPRLVEDIEAFGNHVLVDGAPLFDDDIRTIVVPPLETADAVVLQTLRKAMVPIEAATIFEWFLEVTNVDLYFRPLYVFEFNQLDHNGNLIGSKLEELDALNPDRWVNLESTEYQMPSVPWAKILRLSADIGGIMLRDVPILGTGRRIAGTIGDSINSGSVTISKSDSPRPIPPDDLPLRLDAAVPETVALHLPFDLAVAVRREESPLLQEEELTRARSAAVQVEWPAGATAVDLRVHVHAPDCHIAGQPFQLFRLRAGQDSPVVYFSLTPQRLGDIPIRVTLFQVFLAVGSARLTARTGEHEVGRLMTQISSHLRPVAQSDEWTGINTLIWHTFSLEEFETLCFEMGIDPDDLAGTTRQRKIGALVDFCRRRELTESLIAHVLVVRPNWMDLLAGGLTH